MRNKRTRWLVIEIKRRIELADVTLMHDCNPIGKVKCLTLVVRDQQRANPITL